MTGVTHSSVDAVVAFYENLSPESVGHLSRHYAEDACFKDPFNEVRGLAPIQRIFMHMFERVSEPRFVIVERVVDDSGALLVWEFRYRTRWSGRGASALIRGAAHLRFDAAGKVVWHRDYWDAAEELYSGLPLIGWLMRGLRKALAS